MFRRSIWKDREVGLSVWNYNHMKLKPNEDVWTALLSACTDYVGTSI
jgi:hypothetical protein